MMKTLKMKIYGLCFPLAQTWVKGVGSHCELGGGLRRGPWPTEAGSRNVTILHLLFKKQDSLNLHADALQANTAC